MADIGAGQIVVGGDVESAGAAAGVAVVTAAWGSSNSADSQTLLEAEQIDPCAALDVSWRTCKLRIVAVQRYNPRSCGR